MARPSMSRNTIAIERAGPRGLSICSITFHKEFSMFTLILVAINVATLVAGAKCPRENNEPDTGPFYCCC